MSTTPGRRRRQLPERNTLSWTRTSLDLSLISMLLLKWSNTYGPWVFALIGSFAALSLTITVTQRTRYRAERHALRHDAAPANVGSVLTVTAMLLLLGTGGIALVLAG